MWKFHYFSVIQILREINFGESISYKDTVFDILWAMTFGHLVNISLQRVQKFTKLKYRASQCIKFVDFETLV